MRKLVTAAFISLDGVMQAPGGPEEDPSGGFRFGGWTAPYYDPAFAKGTAENSGQPFDLVLGRKTYDMWSGYWPKVDTDPDSNDFAAEMAEIASSFNRATKYVAAHSPPDLSWQNSQW